MFPFVLFVVSCNASVVDTHYGNGIGGPLRGQIGQFQDR